MALMAGRARPGPLCVLGRQTHQLPARVPARVDPSSLRTGGCGGSIVDRCRGEEGGDGGCGRGGFTGTGRWAVAAAAALLYLLSSGDGESELCLRRCQNPL